MKSDPNVLKEFLGNSLAEPGCEAWVMGDTSGELSGGIRGTD
jgi:hypothetical protein